MQDYSNYDGVGLAELVAKRAVTPGELVEAAIARVEQHNPVLNAVVYEGFDDARARAAGDLPDGPFKGVPFLIKDLGMPVAGWPRTSGSKFARGMVDAEDGGLTARYRASGVVPIGKSNTPEYGITGTTESAHLGPCRNPWNPAHIAGGSSGGSASAVAAGIVPMAHASDGLGSIRIPAACCGLVGLKVTRDRNPNMPDGFDYALGNVVDHIVSRTVRDSAVMLDATGYAAPGAPYPAPRKDRPYAQEVEASPGKLRIAWSSETPNGRPIEPEIQAALERSAALLKGLAPILPPLFTALAAAMRGAARRARAAQTRAASSSANCRDRRPASTAPERAAAPAASRRAPARPPPRARDGWLTLAPGQVCEGSGMPADSCPGSAGSARAGPTFVQTLADPSPLPHLSISTRSRRATCPSTQPIS